MQQAPAQSTTPTAPTPAKAPAAPRVAAQPSEQPIPRAPDALYIKRAEIGNQLEALKDRREELTDQRDDMHPDNRAGHNERIRVIDQRSAQLERELYQVDDQIARALNQGIAVGEIEGRERDAAATETSVPSDRDQMRRDIGNAVEDAVIGTLAGTGTFLLAAFVVWKGFRRWIWKRKPAPAISADQSVQIAQLQRSMDVVAVEVERISEAQRYVAKLLNDRSLGAGDAQPVKSRARDAVGAESEQR